MKADSLGNLRNSLFWDVNPKQLNAEKDAEFIIGRVLDLGNLKEWRLIKRLYGKGRIADIARNHVFADFKSANFWSLILSVPADQLKCARKPSLKIPNAFLNR